MELRIDKISHNTDEASLMRAFKGAVSARIPTKKVGQIFLRYGYLIFVFLEILIFPQYHQNLCFFSPLFQRFNFFWSE